MLFELNTKSCSFLLGRAGRVDGDGSDPEEHVLLGSRRFDHVLGPHVKTRELTLMRTTQ